MKNNLNLHSVSFDNVGGAFVSFDTFLVLFKPSPEAFISPLPPPSKKKYPGGGGGAKPARRVLRRQIAAVASSRNRP